MSKKTQKIIFAISIFIHLFYYLSAYFTRTLDIFFDHITMGQDFFQIPNAAYSFLRGGSLTGVLPPGIEAYTTCCGVNSNVYHPFFTILVGSPLQLLPPWSAFAVWGFLHIAASAFLVYFIWRKFKHQKYVYLALSFYLLNTYQYYEIWHAQYHFLVNFFTILFFYTITRKNSPALSGILFFLSLIVKPIGLLWAIPLLVYKKYKPLMLGLGLYIVVSIPFFLLPIGKYFFTNIYSVMRSPFPTYNLYSLVHVIHVPTNYIQTFSYVWLIFIVAVCIMRKLPIFILLASLVFYQLLFYPLTFPYHYSILAGLLMLGIVMGIIKNLPGYIATVFLTIPTPIIFFHLTGSPSKPCASRIFHKRFMERVLGNVPNHYFTSAKI